MALQPHTGADHDDAHGGRDITQQQHTFHAFIRLTQWAVGVIFLGLLFLALVNS
ncbi:aa3-type cytochrome c oxidase subunit IV (plasmid) [Paroceanicella profunda]|uniref:Aa3-type cytochrome c oxidase subunit IV n=1 Tax=Paroceanicella profunda TaxID=2579971 RepID=A0A5B8FJF9_9RHOB|nr:aa3-type cytochrome c oxidase subunit IV [Paroceanicella profunda]QDL94377.1 aa3-type cytochrome c oxidase subunit IV [Paroceanicella profunda]